uniref:Uncharacterized protein n=1 Tax=Cajanus cajan TaxID=3821 RepID=A0A151TC41_CAJCA|nr:hypothetical protein KK1_019210 [Cajanus cajan]
MGVWEAWVPLKGNAKRRLKRKANVEKMLHLFNLCDLLFLFSQSFSHLFHSSFYVFLLLNAIILFLFALNKNVIHSPPLLLTAFRHHQLIPDSLSTPSPLSQETLTPVAEGEGRLRSVEQLSEEEFNRAVEDFIAMHKRMQWEEQIIQN